MRSAAPGTERRSRCARISPPLRSSPVMLPMARSRGDDGRRGRPPGWVPREEHPLALPAPAPAILASRNARHPSAQHSGRSDSRRAGLCHNAVAARSVPIATLKVRIREPMPSQFRSAAPTHAQVTRLPMAAIENTTTITAILATVALLTMNDPAVAAASINALGLAY